MSEVVAAVTGAAGGLGTHLCEALAEIGCKVILIDRDARKSQNFAAALNQKHPGCVLGSFAVDLADHNDIRRMTRELLEAVDHLDFLFNNAGVLTETLQFSKHHNELHFEVNTLAPLALIDQLRPALEASGKSVVVNTSAGLALRAKTLEWQELLRPSTFAKLYGPYVNSKEALNVVTAGLARELAPSGITVRAADPGPNQTALTRGSGTPLWMRLFYGFLPSPEKGATKILEAGTSLKYSGQTGVFISNGKVQPLPPALSDPGFQADFLARCRQRAAMSD